jgi:hypothetical protein
VIRPARIKWQVAKRFFHGLFPVKSCRDVSFCNFMDNANAVQCFLDTCNATQLTLMRTLALFSSRCNVDYDDIWVFDVLQPDKGS